MDAAVIKIVLLIKVVSTINVRILATKKALAVQTQFALVRTIKQFVHVQKALEVIRFPNRDVSDCLTFANTPTTVQQNKYVSKTNVHYYVKTISTVQLVKYAKMVLVTKLAIVTIIVYKVKFVVMVCANLVVS